MNKKFLISIGTRPEIIKMMPVYFELQKRGLQPILLHTGQHDELATAFYKFFEVTPDYNILLDRESLRGEYGDDLSALSSLLLKKISYILCFLTLSFFCEVLYILLFFACFSSLYFSCLCFLYFI